MMRDYVIMTDSCADLSAEEAAENEVIVLPLTYTIDGVSYLDTPDHDGMPIETFYRRLREGAVCKTAGVGVGAFEDAMARALEGGKDVLCICFSGALSSTCRSAAIAAEGLRERFPDGRVEVIDSLAVTRGQGKLALEAAARRREGMALAQAAEWTRAMLPRLSQWFIVDDLNFLRRGGRLNPASAIIGTALGIKPMLHADMEGKLTPVGKIHGRKRAMDALIDRVKRLTDRPLNEQTVYLSHAGCREDADFTAGQLRRHLGVADVRVGYLGPVCGSHAGPGTLYLAFWGKER